MIPIEKKRVPIPSAHHGKGRPRRYPFELMKVGQSFFVKGKRSQDLSGSCVLAQQRLRWQFTKRTMDGGVRVWRIK